MGASSGLDVHSRASLALRAGETEAQHRELVDFAREFAFERMGAFAYSAEEGTPAASLPEQARPGVEAP